MSTLERLKILTKKLVADGYAKNQKELAKKLGYTESSFSQILNGHVNFPNTLKHKLKELDNSININWLITGEGPMTIEEMPNQPQDRDIILVPVLNLDSRGGFNFNAIVDAPEYIVSYMPFNKAVAMDGDFVLTVYGDSMAPRYPSGSRILVRPIPMWQEYIEFGTPHVLDLMDERRLLKIIDKGSDKSHFLLRSLNPEYQANEINKSIIRRVFRVLASISLESLI